MAFLDETVALKKEGRIFQRGITSHNVTIGRIITPCNYHYTITITPWAGKSESLMSGISDSASVGTRVTAAKPRHIQEQDPGCGMPEWRGVSV